MTAHLDRDEKGEAGPVVGVGRPARVLQAQQTVQLPAKPVSQTMTICMANDTQVVI